MRKNTASIPYSAAKKMYAIEEAERISIKIAQIGSEGLCYHCKFKNICNYSTTTYRLGASRLECDGKEYAVSHDETFVTEMGYKFVYEEEK